VSNSRTVVEDRDQREADRMRVGEVGVGVMVLPVAVPFERIVATARAADEHGFEALWLFDHLDTPHATPATPIYDVFEGWTTAAVLAAKTERLVLGHNVLCDSFRHPAVLAKMAATLDVATGGRVELGIGWGSMPDELHRFGVTEDPPAVRSARLRESLEVLRRMFTGEPFSFEGEHHKIPDGVGRPRPTRGTIPINLGGAGPTLTMPLVAEYADWWNIPANSVDRLEELRPLAGDARVAAQIVVGLARSTSERSRIIEQADARFGDWAVRLAGTPDDVVTGMRGLAARGIERFVVQFHDYGRPETLALFAAEVLGSLT
jgi:alkanesulfonate monooxygenase SsuD/methylene tetrahydromethanopterin reductase-like flavin-dependent oxidoreductase (luciferase family)